MTIACNGDKWPNTNPNPLETFIGGKNGLPLPYATPTGYYLKKYLDASTDISAESGSGGKRHNWVIFRLGEFYLNYAEAIYVIWERPVLRTTNSGCLLVPQSIRCVSVRMYKCRISRIIFLTLNFGNDIKKKEW